jgi:putative ABC transport system permease protein
LRRLQADQVSTEIEIPGTPPTTPQSTALVQLCSDGFFQTFDRRLVRGRIWSEAEGRTARKLAVVNQALVDRYFGGTDPLGKSVMVKRLTSASDPVLDPVFEIIGVIADAKNRGPRELPVPEVHVPSAVTGSFIRGIFVRTATAPLTLRNAVRDEVWAVERGVALSRMDSLDGFLRRAAYAHPRFNLIVLGAFAGIGLVLVAIGVYGVMAYTISRQTQEIAVRMALGASRWQVVQLVLWLGLRLIGAGIAFGLLASVGTNRLIANQLWNTSPRDPLTLAVGIATIAVIGLAACGVPAWRAVRLEPMRALRHE